MHSVGLEGSTLYSQQDYTHCLIHADQAQIYACIQSKPCPQSGACMSSMACMSSFRSSPGDPRAEAQWHRMCVDGLDDLVEWHAYPDEVLAPAATGDIGCALALLTCKVQPPADPPTGMGHDPQPRLQNSSHHCNVGAMPQQPPVVKVAVFGETCCFCVPVHSP